MSRWLNELADWWAALPPEWVFLMLLPFAVAGAAFLAEGVRTWRHERSEAPRRRHHRQPRSHRRPAP